MWHHNAPESQYWQSGNLTFALNTDTTTCSFKCLYELDDIRNTQQLWEFDVLFHKIASVEATTVLGCSHWHIFQFLGDWFLPAPSLSPMSVADGGSVWRGKQNWRGKYAFSDSAAIVWTWPGRDWEAERVFLRGYLCNQMKVEAFFKLIFIYSFSLLFLPWF